MPWISSRRSSPAARRRDHEKTNGVRETKLPALRSLSRKLNDHVAISRTRIEIDYHYLLPGSQQELALQERNGERRLEQRRANVAGAVVIAPRIVMVIVRTFRNDLLKKLVQILHKPGFKFHRCDSSRGAGDKNSRMPFLQSATLQRFTDRGRDVLGQ